MRLHLVLRYCFWSPHFT